MTNVIAIFIKTVGREACLRNTITSIYRFCDLPFRLYIADEGRIAPAKQTFYHGLAADGHIIEIFPNPTSVNAARNALAARLGSETAILRIDDDFEFFERTRISTMRQILDGDPMLGAIADIEIQCGKGKNLPDGAISPHQGFLEKENGVLRKCSIAVEDWQWRQVNGCRYAYCDHSRNFLLIRRACLESCPWDGRIFFRREHLDFMQGIVAAGWRLGFTPDSAHRHRDDLSQAESDQDYTSQKRESHLPKTSDEAFYAKWGITKVVGVKDPRPARVPAPRCQAIPPPAVAPWAGSGCPRTGCRRRCPW